MRQFLLGHAAHFVTMSNVFAMSENLSPKCEAIMITE
jgi:hypothetical protein